MTYSASIMVEASARRHWVGRAELLGLMRRARLALARGDDPPEAPDYTVMTTFPLACPSSR